jgi:NAD dependent epimerase/dehydratase family enzyme
VNVVAPHPVTNSEFTKALGTALHRPTIFPMPAFAARIALGEMADEMLLSSTRVVPTKLQAAGFEFLHPDVKGGLAAALSG